MTRRNLSLLFLGAILIFLGVLWGGNSFGIWDVDLFFHGWWTLFLIIPPIFGMIQHGVKSFDLIVLFIGLVFLFSSQGIFSWGTVSKLFLPALLIVIGLLVIFSIFRRKKVPGIDREAMAHLSAVFSGIKHDFVNETYTGGRVEAVFGSVDLDLRGAVIEQDIYMEVNAVFGGVKIFFPPNVRVIADKNAVFGGVSDKTVANNAVNTPQVHIECNAVFGGVELF
ncbi:MAG TPA: LiaF-related protein [Clostridiales bacterium]|nr:LiaF-related protein [Clostridiales bacterium]